MHKILKSASVFVFVCLLSAGHGTHAFAGDNDHSNHNMTMHHMHMMLNHAVELSAKGSNLIMMGEMGMAKGVDSLSVEKGKALIAEAKAIIAEVMKGKTMEHMHMDGVTGTNDMMLFTHNLGDAAQKYVELVEKMNTSMHHH